MGAFVAAANVADANGWKVGGQVTSADGDWSILANILASGGGVPLDRGGRLSCFVRSPKVATFTLRRDEVLGSRKVTTSTSFRDRVNTTIPSCRQEAQKWEVVAGQAVSVSDWVDDDGGEIRTEEIAFPLVSSYVQAHQLATYWLCDSREFLELEVTAKPRALNVEVGDCIEVELPEFASGQTFIVMGRKWDAATKTVGLTLKSETFAKHAFALGQSQTPPTPPTLDTFDPTRPSGPAALDWAITANKIETTEEVEIPAEDPEDPPVTITRARTIIPALVISGEVRDPNVQRIIVEVREQTVPEEGPPFWPEDEDEGWVSGTEGTRDATELTVAPLKPLTEYQVSVRYETLTGAFSERIILGPEETARDQAGGVGPGTVDWDDPQGPLINVPPVLRDLLDGQIRANLVAIEGEVNTTVQAAYLAAEAARTDLDNRVTADISRIDGLITLTEPEAGTPGRRILDTAIEAEEALGRISGLEVVIGEPGEGEPGGTIRSRIAGLELITTDGSLVTAETLATVQAAVDGLSANSVAHTTAIGNLESSRATVTALNAVQASANARNRTFAQDAQPTGSPGGIGLVVGDLWMDTDADNRIYRWSGTAWVDTDNGGVAALAELELARGAFPNLNARFGTLSTTVSDALAGKAAATDFTTLQTEVTNARGGASSLADRLTTVQSALDGKASASSVTALSSSVSIRNRTFRQSSAPTSPIGGHPLVAGDIWIDTSANNTIHWWTGLAWSGSADPRIATSAQGVTDLTAKIGTVSGTVADALAGKASASSVTSLSATVADHTSSISSLQSVTASLDGTLDAKVGLVLNVNGKISGFSSQNNGTTSTFDIQADVFRLANGSTAIVPFAVIGSTVYAQNVVLKNGTGSGTTEASGKGIKIVDPSGVTRIRMSHDLSLL